MESNMSSKYSFSVSVKNFWLVVLPLAFLMLVIGGAAGFLIVDNVIMPRFTDLQNRNDVIVPDLVGMDVERAAQTAFDLGLRTIRNRREFSDFEPHNSVIGQEPKVGETVKRGRHIFLTLSRGPEVAQIPTVEGLAEGPSRSELRRAGFENLSSRHVFNERIPLNAVIETQPAAGTRISRDGPVVIMISRGPTPTHANVPNVVGEMLSEARSTIESRGLRIGRVRYEESRIMSAGQVISQSLTPGTDVILESTIDVVVAAER
jgi:serine/threonine-protein kinase